MNLISKKDLLAITGISYGQLYRWKRERLIPEEWFIKQSAYTGQETFFPREQILSRIQSILELKDKYSLEELSKILSPENSVAKITIKELMEVSEIDKGLLDHLPDILGKDKYEFNEIIFVIAISEAAKKIGLSDWQLEDILQKSISTAVKQKSINITCSIILAGGEYHTVFSTSPASIEFDDEIQVMGRIALSEVADRIKTKYKNQFVL